MPLIPEGNYTAVIVGSEFKDASTAGNKYVSLKIVVTQGQYANTEFTERLNIINSNPTAVKMAYETLARIAKAVGMASIPDDTSKLHNKPFTLKVVTEEAKPYKDKDGVEREGKPKSIIDGRGYAPLPSVGTHVATIGETLNIPATATTPAQTAGKMPWE